MKNKVELSFDVTNLPSWNDVEGTLTAKALVQNHLAGIPGIRTVNIPSGALSIEVPYVYSTPVFRTAACGWTSTGQTSLGSRTCLTYGYELMESLCGKSLKSKAIASMMNGNGIEGFQQELIDEKLKQIQKTSQDIAINGNTASGSGYLNIGNGLLYKLDNTYSASTVNVTKSALTNSSTVISYVDAILSNIPDEIRDMDSIVMLISPTAFQTLQVALRNTNPVYYNYNTTVANTYSFAMPGYSNVTVYSVPSMANNRAIVTYPQNIIHALGVETPLELWFSKDNQEYRIHAEVYEAYDVHFEGLVVRM